MTAQLDVPAELRHALETYNMDTKAGGMDEEKAVGYYTTALLSLIEQVGKEIIGEDTSHKYYGQHEDDIRNKLKAAQRQTLNALLKGEKDE